MEERQIRASFLLQSFLPLYVGWPKQFLLLFLFFAGFCWWHHYISIPTNWFHFSFWFKTHFTNWESTILQNTTHTLFWDMLFGSLFYLKMKNTFFCKLDVECLESLDATAYFSPRNTWAILLSLSLSICLSLSFYLSNNLSLSLSLPLSHFESFSLSPS